MDQILKKALEEEKVLKKTFAKEMTSIKKYPKESDPVSVFMAGSPGAGKTEVAREILKSRRSENKVIHIDPDEIRKQFSEYTGENAELFQGHVSAIVNKIHDYALDNSQSFIFDGTLSGYTHAKNNIERSLKEGRRRVVSVIYVYQDPLQAWKFIQARKRDDGRKVPKSAFIKQYFAARETVNRLAQEYRGRVTFDLVVKNVDGTNQEYYKSFSSIDERVPERYSQDVLEKLI